MTELLARLADPRDPLRQTLEVARAWGVPPGRFLGIRPSSVTVHTYDDRGRVIRSVTTGEPDWTDDDREMAYALASFEADLCRGCGLPLAETTRPDREDHYQAHAAIRCHRCTASAQAAELYRTSPHAEALMVPVSLRSAPDEKATPE